jgi:hypothetical protein
MRLMVGHTTKWAEAYGVINDVQDYNLDKSVAAASLLDDVAELVTIAKQRGGPAKMILALEPEQGSAVLGGNPCDREVRSHEVATPEAGRRTRLNKSTLT